MACAKIRVARTCRNVYFLSTISFLFVATNIIQAQDANEKHRTGTATVQLKNFGELKGIVYEEDGAPPADVFLGIPYAKPPIRTLRFKVMGRLKTKTDCILSSLSLFQFPEPPDPWHGSTYDATVEKQWCIQFWYPDDRLEIRNQSEDCLYLNIIKPHAKVDILRFYQAPQITPHQGSHAFCKKTSFSFSPISRTQSCSGSTEVHIKSVVPVPSPSTELSEMSSPEASYLSRSITAWDRWVSEVE